MGTQIIAFPTASIDPNHFEEALAETQRNVTLWSERVVELTKELRAARLTLDFHVKHLEVQADRAERA